MGYHRAGFKDIVGVDIEPQPRYPFEFVQGDALEYLEAHGAEFDLIHASPPCQAYSRATAWRGSREKHPNLIDIVRIALLSVDKPYVIENVQDARHLLINPLMLCGTHFGLRIRRHRYFEAPALGLVLTPVCRHDATDYSHDHGGKQPESVYRDAMQCEWMTVQDAREAIPPAYTEWLGRRIIAAGVR
jgi:DNA (cytosine-5)-methyltransferase 1